MTPRTIRLTGAAALVAIIGASASVALAEEAVIKYRQAVMGGLGAHMGAMSRIVRGEVDYAEHALDHAQALNALAHMIVDATPEGSGEGAENRTLDVIWEDWDGFVAAAENTQEATMALVAAAEGGDLAAIGEAFGAVGESCGACHDDYRAE